MITEKEMERLKVGDSVFIAHSVMPNSDLYIVETKINKITKAQIRVDYVANLYISVFNITSCERIFTEKSKAINYCIKTLNYRKSELLENIKKLDVQIKQLEQ